MERQQKTLHYITAQKRPVTMHRTLGVRSWQILPHLPEPEVEEADRDTIPMWAPRKPQTFCLIATYIKVAETP